MTAGKGHQIPAPSALALQGQIVPLQEELGLGPAKIEGSGSDKEFDGPILPPVQEPGQQRPWRPGFFLAQFFGQGETFLIIHRPPVVGVHQRKIPDFRALIKVRDARRGDFEHELGEGIQGPEEGHPRLELLKILKERVVGRWFQDPVHKGQ